MQFAPVQVTVVEYVSEFFRKYKSRAYGRSISLNAKGGADALMGMLRLVLSKGGRDELRIALHCFKDQLAAALRSAPSVRTQHIEDLFALLSALIDAAEKLRQFSPVKESLSAAVLEELRWRLFRILAGDSFSQEVDIRRRALDIVFTAYMREQNQQLQQQQRHKQLAAAGAASPQGRVSSPSKASKLLQRKGKGGGVTGPNVSSWEGLWFSLTVVSGRRMLPLLQSAMSDLYLGRYIAGTPAAAAAAGAMPATMPGAAAASGIKTSQTPTKQSFRSSSEVPVSAAPAVAISAVAEAHTTAPAATATATETNADGVAALCGVSTPPLRSSDGETPSTSRQTSSSDTASAAAVDAAAAAVDQPSSPSKQPQQHPHDAALRVSKDFTTAAAHKEASDTDAADTGSPTAVEAAAAAAHDVVYVPSVGLAHGSAAWVSCASSSYCPTEGSIDGTDISVSSSIPTSVAQGHAKGYAQQYALEASAVAGTSLCDDAAAATGSSTNPSSCSSPTSSGKKGFAAKFKEFKESVKESMKEGVANVKEGVANVKESVGGSSHAAGSGSSSSAWIPRSWVQFGHGRGHEREQDQHEVVQSAAVMQEDVAVAAVAAAAAAEPIKGGFAGEDSADWSSCSGSHGAVAAPPAMVKT